MFPRNGMLTTWLLCVCLGCSAPLAQRQLSGAVLSGQGVGGSGVDDALDVELRDSRGISIGDASERQLQSECERALAETWRVLDRVRNSGAEVEFGWWVQQGALTMTSWRRTVEGGGVAAGADASAFFRSASTFRTFIGDRIGALRVVYRREDGGWRLVRQGFDSGVRWTPPEVKSFPEDVRQIRAGPFATLEQWARQKWIPLLQAPVGEHASFDVVVDFDDERLLASTPVRYRPEGRGARVEIPPSFETELAGALVPFTQGLGRRSVRMTLELVSEPGSTTRRWRVREVATVRQIQGEQDEAFTHVVEYRLLHEEIVRRWREQVQDTAKMAAAFSAEQIAIWVVGGWVARGVGAGLELAAGPVLRVLGRGGIEASEWLYCLLRRIPKVERDAFGGLWAKLDAEGLSALSKAESAELRGVLAKLDVLARTPLSTAEKGTMRDIARRRFWSYLSESQPAVRSRLVADPQGVYEVHHKFPLEYAHLVAEEDVNAVKNLVALKSPVHDSIGEIWSALRSGRVKPELADVQQVVAIVNRHYARWYNAVFDIAREKTELQTSQNAALLEVQAMLEHSK